MKWFFRCQCDQGWTGDKCQYNYSCQCKNGGICTNLQGNHTCDCSNTGYRGRQCEELINSCSSGLCQNGGVCTSQPVGYNCKCNPGYTGKNCQIIEGKENDLFRLSFQTYLHPSLILFLGLHYGPNIYLFEDISIKIFILHTFSWFSCRLSLKLSGT